jgi:hypothetical protein
MNALGMSAASATNIAIDSLLVQPQAAAGIEPAAPTNIRLIQWPMNWATRFSWKAFTPSWQSAVRPATI